MFVECCVGSSRCDGLIAHSETSYRLCLICVRFINLKNGRSRPDFGCCTTRNRKLYAKRCQIFHCGSSIQPPLQCVPGFLSLGIKWPQREDDPSPPSSVEVKNEWSYTSIQPTPLRCRQGQLYLFSGCFIKYCTLHNSFSNLQQTHIQRITLIIAKSQIMQHPQRGR